MYESFVFALLKAHSGMKDGRAIFLPEIEKIFLFRMLQQSNCYPQSQLDSQKLLLALNKYG